MINISNILIMKILKKIENMKRLFKKFWDSYKEVMTLYGEAITISKSLWWTSPVDVFKNNLNYLKNENYEKNSKCN